MTGDVESGFTAEFVPRDVGVHSINVEYNRHPVNGTPFLAKAFNADKVLIGPVARGSVGQSTHFIGEFCPVLRTTMHVKPTCAKVGNMFSCMHVVQLDHTDGLGM